jgi:hypothetical protein
MIRKCQVCGALLSSYNTNKLCCPCMKKRNDLLEQKLVCSPGYRMDYLYEVLERKGRRMIGLMEPNVKVRV